MAELHVHPHPDADKDFTKREVIGEVGVDGAR
jgi:hypothetical protein